MEILALFASLEQQDGLPAVLSRDTLVFANLGLLASDALGQSIPLIDDELEEIGAFPVAT